jgi:hypothetical protein
MGNETQDKLEALSKELIKSKEAIRKIKASDEKQQVDIDRAKQNGKLKTVLHFFDKTKWFWLITSTLVFLLATGYRPAQIIVWIKELVGVVGIGN